MDLNLMSKGDREILLESLKQMKNGEVRNVVPPEHAIRSLVETCQRTGLDWKDRHLYLIERGGKWRVELSIDAFRIVANRDENYDGQAGPFYAMSPEGPWTDVPPAKEPYAAKVGVRRKGQSEPTWGIAKFSSYTPNTPNWKKMPEVMIAKCAEMLALRKALPKAFSGLYGKEEMEQIDRKEPGKSERKSSKAQTEAGPAPQPSESRENAYAADIDGATTDITLKNIGAEIQKDDRLDQEAKMRLSVLYKAKKTKENWS